MHRDLILIVLFFRRKEPKESVFLNAFIASIMPIKGKTYSPPPSCPFARPVKKSGRMPSPWSINYGSCNDAALKKAKNLSTANGKVTGCLPITYLNPR